MNMISGKRINNLAFTIAYGDSRFSYMAETLQKSFKYWNPEIEFKIFGDEFITPIKNFNKNKNLSKRFKKTKIRNFI